MFDWINEASKQEVQQNDILSFQDYMEHFERNPHRECRPTYEYLIDMFTDRLKCSNHFIKTW